MTEGQTILPNGEVTGDPGDHFESVMDLSGPGWDTSNPFACNDQELSVIKSFLQGATKKQAAIDGGYTGGYPSRWAGQLLQRERCQQEIKRHAKDEATELLYNPNKVLHRLVMIAESNIIDTLVLDKKKKLKLAKLQTLPASLQYAIKSIKFSPGGVVTIELHDKLKALDRIGQFFDMWGPNSSRGGSGAGEGGQILEEQIVFEKRMNDIGEVISARIDRVIRQFPSGPPRPAE